jgi:hypothetical protein
MSTPYASLAEALGLVDPAVIDAPPVEFPDDLTAQQLCERMLRSVEWRVSVQQRMTLGTLPAALEVRLMEYAWGKPTEHIEHTGKDGGPIHGIAKIEIVMIDPAAAREAA